MMGAGAGSNTALNVAALALLWLGAPSAFAQSATAEYEVVFDAIWSAATHPIEFPESAHFSGLIGGTHDGLVSFWQTGALASSGIQSMAETGSKFTLRNEVNAAIGAGSADSVLSGGDIPQSPGSVSLRFTAHQDYPLLTLVAMVAPSPDWFVGISSLNLQPGGQWVDEVVVPLNVYDAGTDSGTTFLSPDEVTTPPIPIAVFDSGPFAGSMQYVGTYTITRTDAPPPPSAAPALEGPAMLLLAGGLICAGRGLAQRRWPQHHPSTS